jgi:hypothetical protein
MLPEPNSIIYVTNVKRLETKSEWIEFDTISIAIVRKGKNDIVCVRPVKSPFVGGVCPVTGVNLCGSVAKYIFLSDRRQEVSRNQKPPYLYILIGYPPPAIGAQSPLPAGVLCSVAVT